MMAAGICGRGVAQQILSELRAGRQAKEIQSVAEEGEPPSKEIGGLLTHLDDLHLEVDKKRCALALSAAALIEDMKAAFGVIIADQGLALQRSEENSRIQIEFLEASFANATRAGAAASEKLEAAEAERAELFARMTDAEEHRDALLAGLAAAEMERDQHSAAAEQLCLDLEANWHDLAMSREAETTLRDEMRASAAGHVDRLELVAKHEALPLLWPWSSPETLNFMLRFCAWSARSFGPALTRRRQNFQTQTSRHKSQNQSDRLPC